MSVRGGTAHIQPMTTLSLTHNGITYNAVPGTIARTALGTHQGHASALLVVRLPDGILLDIGDYVLDWPRPDRSGTEGTAFGMDYLLHVMRAAGVPFWEEMIGRPLMVLFQAGKSDRRRAYGLARADGTHAFVFAELSAAWEGRRN